MQQRIQEIFLKQAQSNAENALKDAKTQIDGVTGKAKAELQKQYDTVNSGFQNLKGQVNGAVNKMNQNIKQSNDKFKTKADGSTKNLFEALWDYIISLFNGVKNAATNLAKKAKQVGTTTPQSGGRKRGPRISHSKIYFNKRTRRRRRKKTKNKRNKNTKRRRRKKVSRKKR